jgi:high affinity Mn2+ porin
MLAGSSDVVAQERPGAATTLLTTSLEPPHAKLDDGKKPDTDAPDKDDKDKDKGKDEKPEPTWYSIHGQATVVYQGNGKFRSPYSGTRSFQSILDTATTETTTLYLAARILQGSELVFNPEVAGGAGLSGTSGIAGFPNGEATRVGLPAPTPYVARLYWKQTIGLGGETEKVEDGPSQVAGERDVDRITFRIGKMAATDAVDDNRYSHDPRTQFMNWSLMYNGAWDYPANVRGYTYGGTVELNRKDWAVRYGIFAEPVEANGADLDPHVLRAHGQVVEWEQRYEWMTRPGKLRFLGFWNTADMGNYRLALQQNPLQPDVTLTRTYRTKYGFGFNWEQEYTDDVGLFARAGWNDGQTETWAFTEIDQTVSAGLVIKGKRWCRPDDKLGFAVVFNGLSDAHRDYLAAGGVGFIVGDGRLNYGWEQIAETYYDFQIRPGADLGLGLQGVNHPGYNRDRGPLALVAMRLHFEF